MSRRQYVKPNGEQCGTEFGITQHGFCWHQVANDCADEVAAG